MRGLPTGQLPYAFDGTEIRAVGRTELQGKARLGLAAPVLMHSGMVVGSIVERITMTWWPARMTVSASGYREFFHTHKIINPARVRNYL